MRHDDRSSHLFLSDRCFRATACVLVAVLFAQYRHPGVFHEQRSPGQTRTFGYTTNSLLDRCGPGVVFVQVRSFFFARVNGAVQITTDKSLVGLVLCGIYVALVCDGRRR